MAVALSLKCPNCGSVDACRSDGAYLRCSFCRSVIGLAPAPAAKPSAREPLFKISNLKSQDTVTRYTALGLLAVGVCWPAAPIIWFVGYCKAVREGKDPGRLGRLTVMVGLPLFAVIIVPGGLLAIAALAVAIAR